MKTLTHLVLFTVDGTGLAIARKAQAEGVTVTVAQVQDKNELLPKGAEPCSEDEMTKSRRLDLYHGLLDIHPAKEVFDALLKVKNKDGYFIFFDLNDCCAYAEPLEAAGFDGNFPHFDELELEEDRDKARAFVEEHYNGFLEVAPKPEFSSVEDGIKFLEENGDDARWALKGETGVETTVPHDKDYELAKQHIIQALKDQKESIGSNKFILERVIDDPIEITPEAWFYDGKLVFTSVDIEMKRIGAGDYGPHTGCSTDLVFAVPKEAEIIQMAFPPIVYEMAAKHKGWFIWDASILFDRDGTPWFGEFCANRLGWDSFQTQCEMFGSVKGLFEQLMSGEEMKPEAPFGSSVRVINMDKDDRERRVLRGAKINWLPEVDEHVWPYDVMKDIDGHIVTVGTDWALAVVTGRGNGPEEACLDVYEKVKGFGIENFVIRPREDFLSRDYPTSLMNRFAWGDGRMW